VNKLKSRKNENWITAIRKKGNWSMVHNYYRSFGQVQPKRLFEKG